LAQEKLSPEARALLGAPLSVTTKIFGKTAGAQLLKPQDDSKITANLLRGAKDIGGISSNAQRERTRLLGLKNNPLVFGDRKKIAEIDSEIRKIDVQERQLIKQIQGIISGQGSITPIVKPVIKPEGTKKPKNPKGPVKRKSLFNPNQAQEDADDAFRR